MPFYTQVAKTVILIDDDQDDLDIITDSIRAIDPVIHCINFIYPEEALRFLSGELIFIPNFVFIDINMPGMNGDKVLRSLRKNKDLDATIITMFSTSIPPAVAQALELEGANHTFQKPNKITDYQKLLSKIIGV